MPFADKSRDGKHAVTGMVQEPKGDKYPVVLGMYTWASEQSNSIQSGRPLLMLEQPYTWGVTGGIVQIYSVTLSKPKIKTESNKVSEHSVAPAPQVQP